MIPFCVSELREPFLSGRAPLDCSSEQQQIDTNSSGCRFLLKHVEIRYAKQAVVSCHSRGWIFISPTGILGGDRHVRATPGRGSVLYSFIITQWE